MASFYRGPAVFSGGDGPCVHWWDNRARGVIAPPSPLSPRSVAPARGAPLLDLLICFHEGAHATYWFLNGQRVHDVSIERGGHGGLFRTVPNPTSLAPVDTPEGGAEQIALMMAAEDDPETRRVFLRNCVGLAVGWAAQHRFGSRHHDDYCIDDFKIVFRVVDALTRDPQRKARYLNQIEAQAHEFCDAHWPEITRVAHALFEHGRLDRQAIERVLTTDTSMITLNQTGVDNASVLVANGAINTGPFAWNDDEDASEYHLGEDGKGGVHYPFGKGGEVYVQALTAAKEAGGVVAAYASKLLAEISAEKAQSTGGRGFARALPRRPGDEPNFYRRVGDGYLK